MNGWYIKDFGPTYCSFSTRKKEGELDWGKSERRRVRSRWRCLRRPIAMLENSNGKSDGRMQQELKPTERRKCSTRGRRSWQKSNAAWQSQSSTDQVEIVQFSFPVATAENNDCWLSNFLAWCPPPRSGTSIQPKTKRSCALVVLYVLRRRYLRWSVRLLQAIAVAVVAASLQLLLAAHVANGYPAAPGVGGAAASYRVVVVPGAAAAAAAAVAVRRLAEERLFGFHQHAAVAVVAADDDDKDVWRAPATCCEHQCWCCRRREEEEACSSWWRQNSPHNTDNNGRDSWCRKRRLSCGSPSYFSLSSSRHSKEKVGRKRL